MHYDDLSFFSDVYMIGVSERSERALMKTRKFYTSHY